MQVIPHRDVIIDTGLAERIITAPGYEFTLDLHSIKRNSPDDLIVVLWNWWISN